MCIRDSFYAEDMDPELSKKNLDALAAFALRQEALLGDGHVTVSYTHLW